MISTIAAAIRRTALSPAAPAAAMPFALLVVSGLALSACESTSHHHDDDHVAEEACEHLQEGSDSVVTAGADAVGAPDVSKAHTRFAAILGGTAGARTGTVKFVADEAGDFRIFLGQDVPLVVKDSAGATVAPEKVSKNVPACPTVAKADYTFEFAAGAHYLTLGPTAADTVRLLIEEAAHAH